LRQSGRHVQNSGQIAIGIQTGFLCLLNDAVNDRTGLCASGRVSSQFFCLSQMACAALSTVVGGLQSAVLANAELKIMWSLFH